MTDLDAAACYRALLTRDARFDGRFFTGVVTTGIYCRPICPARTPKPENCVFLPSAAAAHQIGFRPCLRCRPEAAPGRGGWQGTGATVQRALHLIAEGALDAAGVDALADRLGVGARHLRRLFDAHMGAAPITVAQARRVLFAKTLLAETDLSMTDVALASGFGSVRRFNAAFQALFDRPPGALRRAGSRAAPGGGLKISLPYAPPFDWPGMLAFLRARAVTGVEAADDTHYRRTFAVGRATGWLSVRADPDRPALIAEMTLSDVRALSAVVARLRRLFDLDADAEAIDTHLAADLHLAPLVAARPGVRAPGAWDGFELAVRAILGQQVTVAAATTFASRLAAAHGAPIAAGQGLSRLFPAADALAGVDLRALGLTRARATALAATAKAFVRDPQVLRSAETLDETVRALQALPGVGPWTAHYVALRALREPDAFPAADLALRAALGGLSAAACEARSTPWRPWRAYAAVRLWTQGRARIVDCGAAAHRDTKQVCAASP